MSQIVKFETFLCATPEEGLKAAVEYLCDGIRRGANVDLMGYILQTSLKRWQRADVIILAAHARHTFDPAMPIPEMIRRLGNLATETDDNMAAACSLYLVGAAYNQLGRLDEWEKVAATDGLTFNDLAPAENMIEEIFDIGAIPDTAPVTFGLRRIEDYCSPRIGSRTIVADCGHQCWMSPNTVADFVKAQTRAGTVLTSCNDCINAQIRITK